MDKGKGKSSKGRKKAAMKKSESENARNVRFSKRKAIVFAKASELSTMCGAEVAVLLCSPTGTLFTFGSPSADKVFSQFMTGESSQYCAPDPNLFNLLNQQCVEMSERLEAAKAKRMALNERMKKAVSEAKECEWIGKIDQLGGDELMQLLESLYRARVSLIARMNALSVEGSSVNEMMHALSVEGGVVSGYTVPSDAEWLRVLHHMDC